MLPDPLDNPVTFRNQVNVNFTRHLYANGLRGRDHVLVIGQPTDEMLLALARIVGASGAITVACEDEACRQEIARLAQAGHFTALQPSGASHPAFDLRPPDRRYRAVRLEIASFDSHTLPFADARFQAAILCLPAGSLQAFDALGSEIGRVLKDSGRVVGFSTDGYFVSVTSRKA